MEVVMSLPLELPRQRNDHGVCFPSSSICNLNARDRKLVCVTSGNSYFGSHLIKKLLAFGYLVRVTIQNPDGAVVPTVRAIQFHAAKWRSNPYNESLLNFFCPIMTKTTHVSHLANLEDIKELMREEMEQLESVVVASMGDLESLCSAFRGCHAVFHTSSFIDQQGISGYTERMAFLETEAAKNVIEACGREAYVKRCIFTSSLLACIWKGNDLSNLMNESSWSDEEFCRENKLWLALGKTRAEKAAWSKAREMKVKLVTICPGLVMAPSFPNAHLEMSLPYLKGGNSMLRQGLLATEDVSKVAEAHIYVYEDMDYGACGRYICFGKIIGTWDEGRQLENGLNMHGQLSGDQSLHAISGDNDEISPRITNSKLSRLLIRASQRLSCKQ